MSIIVGKTYKGLTSAEALERTKQYGLNIRRGAKQKTWHKRLFNIVSEPMILLILATAVVYYFIGDQLEATILLISIIPIIFIEFAQESKTDEAIKILDKIITEYCMVYRDGKIVKLESKFLVPGDLVYVTAGDKIGADGYLLNSPGLQIDESILTGESVSTTKVEVGKDVEVVKDENKVFQGTLVSQGEGYIIVEKIGNETEYGKLGDLLEKIISLKTPLQKKIHHLVRCVALTAIFFAVFVGLFLAVKNGWTAGLLGGLTIAISLIPEEFPVVFSVFLIMGVWRMTKEKALIREMAIVELLGSATVICTDKTGTLTEGKMALEKIYFSGRLLTLTQAKKQQADCEHFFKTALLSLEQIAVDPIELETQRFARELNIDTQKFYDEHVLTEDAPFDAKTKLVSHIWKDKSDGYFQYTAGAPESILKYSNISPPEKKKIEEILEENFAEGLRIVAIGYKEIAKDAPVTLNNLKFVGLLIMSDPPREGVREAIELCQKAGIRIIMITGDNKLTAHSIAEQIKLKHNENIISGPELEKLSPDALYEAVKHHDIFARVLPEQKYLLVEALQKHGEIVAMTGDGVNDAPAIKKANIGIAMGRRGTEVARAASGMVLLDDNFSTIVNAIKDGRRIYDNIRHAFVFLFSFHIPIVGLAVLPLFFGQNLIFSPIHIIFLEMICDPSAVLGFEREKARKGLMNESPRSINEPLINPALWKKILSQGVSITVVSFGFYYYFAIYLGQTDLGRTLAFGSLIFSQIFLILINREWEQIKANKFLLYISLITAGFLVLAIYTPFLRKVFSLTPLVLIELLLMAAVPFIVAVFLKLSRLIKIKINY
ncbi:MAG: cation-translocating P-type ATPase [Candidatus Magasanikbacteria bacterium]|nr:cation-translocating P-type ATPase [Candidatus Magasanikbacteria bacterium]